MRIYLEVEGGGKEVNVIDEVGLGVLESTVDVITYHHGLTWKRTGRTFAGLRVYALLQ